MSVSRSLINLDSSVLAWDMPACKFTY
jgi:hypothetical protein